MRFKKGIRPLWQVIRHELIQNADFETQDFFGNSLVKQGDTSYEIDKILEFDDILNRNPRNDLFFISIGPLLNETKIKIYR